MVTAAAVGVVEGGCGRAAVTRFKCVLGAIAAGTGRKGPSPTSLQLLPCGRWNVRGHSYWCSGPEASSRDPFSPSRPCLVWPHMIWPLAASQTSSRLGYLCSGHPAFSFFSEYSKYLFTSGPLHMRFPQLQPSLSPIFCSANFYSLLDFKCHLLRKISPDPPRLG